MRILDLALGVLLDVVLGDPERWPHPVRLLGAVIRGMERLTRPRLRSASLAGVLTVLATAAVAGLMVWGTLVLAAKAGFWAERLVSVLWFYLGFSARQLASEANRVHGDLDRLDLPAARRSVARIVGRETADLDESEVSRAAIESVAENTVDSILAPLFYFAIGGPVLLWIYKAISTCDSMIGYRNERYLFFGRFGARLDDAANYLPARLSYLLFPVAALLTGNSAAQTSRIARRDARHHDSPNSGIPESAMAGVLGIRLGGPMRRQGIVVDHPPFGGEFPAPAARDIPRAVRVMAIVALLGIVLAAGAIRLVEG